MEWGAEFSRLNVSSESSCLKFSLYALRNGWCYYSGNGFITMGLSSPSHTCCFVPCDVIYHRKMQEEALIRGWTDAKRGCLCSRTMSQINFGVFILYLVFGFRASSSASSYSYVAQSGLRLTILLPQLPKWGNERWEPAHWLLLILNAFQRPMCYLVVRLWHFGEVCNLLEKGASRKVSGPRTCSWVWYWCALAILGSLYFLLLGGGRFSSLIPSLSLLPQVKAPVPVIMGQKHGSK